MNDIPKFTVSIPPVRDAIFDSAISATGQEAARKEIRDNSKGTVATEEMARMCREVKSESVYGLKEDD